MWIFLAILFVIVALLWQIPAVGPLLAILLIAVVTTLFWWTMKPRADGRKTMTPEQATALRERTEQAKAESRTLHAEIRVDPSKFKIENFDRAQHEREQHEMIYTNRIDAARIAGEVEGRHYTEWASVIDQMKRDGRLAEALELCLACVDATERQAKVDGLGLPRGYTRNAAIICRRLKDYDGEVAVLERFLAAGGASDEISERLSKARALADRSSEA